MSRVRGESLRSLKFSLKSERAAAARYLVEMTTYRQRATKAEQEAAEWKRRFDQLLMRTPEVPK